MSATPVSHKQVISISPDGVMQSLRRKPGQGLDLRQFGKAEVTRVSEVLFDEEAQKFYVRFLIGDLAGIELSRAGWAAVSSDLTDQLGIVNQKRAYFDEYEEAVAAEVKTLDTIRAGKINADVIVSLAANK